jgi:hypothetical protein
MRYEEPQGPRFQTMFENGAEEIRIPARRTLFVLLFLPFWLAGWTAGGIAAIGQLLATGQLFLVLWLCLWAVGWVFAAATIGWMISGREIVRMIGGDLEVGYRLFGYERKKRYRGSAISGLAAAPVSDLFRRSQFSVPFLMRQQTGSVRFDYGARTVYFGAGLDEAEGRLIVDKLGRKLPSAAVASA